MRLLIKKQPASRSIRLVVYQRSLGPSFLMLPHMAIDYAIAFAISLIQKAITEGIFRYAFLLTGLILIQFFPPAKADPALEQVTAFWTALIEWATLGLIALHIGMNALDILHRFRRSKITYSDRQDMEKEA